jgi:hypothetical protein
VKIIQTQDYSKAVPTAQILYLEVLQTSNKKGWFIAATLVDSAFEIVVGRYAMQQPAIEAFYGILKKWDAMEPVVYQLPQDAPG